MGALADTAISNSDRASLHLISIRANEQHERAHLSVSTEKETAPESAGRKDKATRHCVLRRA